MPLFSSAFLLLLGTLPFFAPDAQAIRHKPLCHSHSQRVACTPALLFSVFLPWVPEIFLACGGNFWCWPKADTSSAVGRSHERRSAGHYKDLTETGNRARKVSGTQGTVFWARLQNSPLQSVFLPIQVRASSQTTGLKK